MFQHSTIITPSETPPVKKILKVREFKDGVCLSLDLPEYFIDPRIKFRSVTPINRAKNGSLTPVNTSNFVQPTFEDMQRVINEIQTIDDSASREAAYNKFMSQFNQSSSSDSSPLTPSKIEE